MIKNILIKLVLTTAVAAACLFVMKNNSAYTGFLKIRNGIKKYEINREISGIEEKLDRTYMKIGRKVSTEDTSEERVKKEIDNLFNLSRHFSRELYNRRNRLIMYDREYGERIVFEKMLENLFSADVSVRLKALGDLSAGTVDPGKSAPYLGMLLVDPAPAVRREASGIIGQIIINSSEEIKKIIPNLEYLNGINFVKSRFLQDKEDKKGGFQSEKG